MTPKDTEAQVGLTAPEDTKRGYGLWRGEVIHPADPRMDAILSSGDPITDTKGLGLRYTPVRGGFRVEHFRADTEQLTAALDGVFPDVHNAVVRLVAEDIRERGFAALKDWCVSSALPEPFEVWEVQTEMRCEGYRPDICVRHPEGGQIELEVVNTHAPEASRLDKAWGAGHIVLSLRIRDVVEEIVFSAGRGVVPEYAELRALLKGRRFTLCGRSKVSEEVRAVWRDLNLAAYCEDLAFEVRCVHTEFVRDYLWPAVIAAERGLEGVERSLHSPRVRALARIFTIEPETEHRYLQLQWAQECDDIALRAISWPSHLNMEHPEAYDFLEPFRFATADTPSNRAARLLKRRLKAVSKIEVALQNRVMRRVTAYTKQFITGAE